MHFTYEIFYNDGKFNLVEKNSQNIIGVFKNRKDAYNVSKLFKKGGFEGWTPQFFLNPHFGERLNHDSI